MFRIKSTVFTVVLLKGKSHFDESCTFDLSVTELSSGVANLNTDELQEALDRTYDYTVLVVEDDPDIQGYLQAELKQNFHVLVADNGVKALELVEKLQPDVVLTDIKMPYMDGLELARKLNQDYPNIYIMLCTGFDEFEYAKEAVHLEIKEYMLKPISATELSESLMKLKATLDREREEKLNVKKLEDYLPGGFTKAAVQFFYSLIEGRVREEVL